MRALVLVSLMAVVFALTTAVASRAQDPAKLAPQNYKVILENEEVRVIQYHLDPGKKEPMHSHPCGVVVYFFNDAKTRIRLPDGKTTEQTVKAGDTIWREPVTHAGENIGNTTARTLLVEPKSTPEGPCREKALNAEPSVQERLIGTWRVVSAGTLRSDGSLEPFPEYGPRPVGYLMYDNTGHMCVTLGNANPPQWVDSTKPTERERAESHRAMNAYCGTYDVHEKEGQIIHRPQLAEWPWYVGSEQVRNFRLAGDGLILSSEETRPGGEQQRYQITWQRVSK